MDDDFLVTVEDLRYLREVPEDGRFCVPGLKAWAKSHGLDIGKFVQDGIKASELLATGDALAIRVVERMRRERQHGHE